MTQAVMSRGAMTFEKSVLAQARLHQLIPGGAHTYARGSDQFPEKMTPVLVRGRGAILFCGPFTDLAFSGFPRVMTLNKRLGRSMPRIASDYYIAAVKRG